MRQHKPIGTIHQFGRRWLFLRKPGSMMLLQTRLTVKTHYKEPFRALVFSKLVCSYAFGCTLKEQAQRTAHEPWKSSYRLMYWVRQWKCDHRAQSIHSRWTGQILARPRPAVRWFPGRLLPENGLATLSRYYISCNSDLDNPGNIICQLLYNI